MVMVGGLGGFSRLMGRFDGCFRAHPYEEPAYEVYRMEDF